MREKKATVNIFFARCKLHFYLLTSSIKSWFKEKTGIRDDGSEGREKSSLQLFPSHILISIPIQTISAKNAAALDKDLMSVGAFSIDQLMELAGLSVSQAGPFPIFIFSFPVC